MCKFTNRLFVFVLLAICQAKASLMPEARDDANNLLLDLLTPDNDYDLHYDQRQRGSENYRIKMDGFFIGLPSDETSDILLLTDDVIEGLGEELWAGVNSKSKGSSSTTSTESNLNYEKAKGTEQTLSATNPERIVVEITPTKRNKEPRQERLDSNIVADNSPLSRTKHHIMHLLSMLRRSRKG